MEESNNYISQLEAKVQQLQAENLQLKTAHRQDSDRRDIRTAAEEQVRNTQIRYRTVFENSLLGNKIIDANLKILQVNSALVTMLGCADKDELIGRHILEFAHPDYKNDWKILQDKLWKRNLPSFHLDTCLVTKNGDSVWVSVTSILFTDDNESLGFTIIENIHDRKAEINSLVIREKRFRMITDIMPQQVWTAGPDGKLNFVNQQVCDYFGLSAEELTGNGWQSYIHPGDQDKCSDAWAAAIASGNEYAIEFRLKGKDDDYRWHLSRAVAIHDDGGISLWLGTNTDIDTQKSSELRKDEFLSIASHELKTPLTSIKAYNQLAVKAKDPLKRDEFIGNQKAHIQRLERLIADLLDVSKINAGKMNYDIAWFDFHDMVLESVTSLQNASKNHKLTITANENVQIFGDRHRIEQVLNNLLANAIKYSPEAKEVILKTELVGDSIVTSVQDFGIGIAAEDLTRLFDRYYRVDNTAMKFEGLGLGLYISAEILKRHNGSLWIESEPGKGSTFYFILPVNGQNLLKDVDTDNQTYYIGNFVTINYNKDLHRLDVDWLGYQNLESVQKGCMIMLDLLKKNKCSDVLNDNTKVLGNWSEASDWGSTYWFPAMTEAGLKRFAWIYSPSVFSRMAANKSAVDHSTNVQIRFFSTPQDAADWLSVKTPV